MTRLGMRGGWWGLYALLGSCVYDSASLDADPFDGLTVLPAQDAATAVEQDDPPAAAAGDDASLAPSRTQVDAGEPAPHGEDAGRDASTGGRDAAAIEGAVRPPDAGSSRPDAGLLVVADAGSTNPADYSCVALDYEHFGRAFMKKYCNDCHSVQSPTLLTLEAVALHKDAVRQTTVTSQRMPLKSGAVPTPAQRVQLGVWLDCGPL
jgi:hypothetical protein